MQGAIPFGATILTVFGVACASSVGVRIDQRGDLAGYRTWDFLALRAENVHAPVSDSRELGARLTRLVERCLQERGFTRVDGRPDFYVSYRLEVQRQVVVTTETPAMEQISSMDDSPSYEVMASKRRVEVQELGRLTIFVTDAEEQAVLWRGGFEGRFRGSLSPHLNGAVASLLGSFPTPVSEDEVALEPTGRGVAGPDDGAPDLEASPGRCEPGI